MQLARLIIAGLSFTVLVAALSACSDRDEEPESPPPESVTALGTAVIPATPASPAATWSADASATGSTAPGTQPPTSSGTCGALPADVTVGETVVREITSGGVVRSYRLHIPESGAGGKPVVLNFHGLGSSAAQQEPYSGLLPHSESEGFVLVTPDGTGSPRGWAGLSLATSGTDVTFVHDLLDALEAELCTDVARVYSTGMSNGAFFSSLLGCVMSDRIAAIAPVAGVAWSEEVDCGRPMPVLAFHGVEDATVPYEAGDIFGFIPYLGAEASVAGWAGHNGCGPEPTAERLSEHVLQLSHQDCEAPAELVTVEDGGHTWPGSLPVPGLGHTTDEISAAEMIWEFFADKRVP